MFTGLIEELGTLVSISRAPGLRGQTTLVLRSHDGIVFDGLHLGDSIACSGVCLTVTAFDPEKREFTVGLSPETIARTYFGKLKAGALLNLERSITPSTKLGGHFVQGHVDGVGVITRSEHHEDQLNVTIRVPKELMMYIVEKGYIAIDGTSLTVTNINDQTQEFSVMLVQYTQDKIILSRKRVSDEVNVETDILGKYFVRVMDRYQQKDIAIKSRL